MEKWFIKNKKGDIDLISRKYGLSEVLSRILINRGFTGEKELDIHLNPTLDKLYDPFLMKDLDLAVDLIKKAIEDEEKIEIVGDYDQDGNSSIMTLYKGIERAGGSPSYSIPHRIRDGYGINEDIVERAYNNGVDLIITCDNGISAFDAVKRAKELGMNIIVTDHHDLVYEEGEFGRRELLPEADAVVNPKRSDCSYPFKLLCGAGVAFKLIQGLYLRSNINIRESYDLLEFVAMGTVCDVVDLVDENRIFVTEGLKRINRTDNIGLRALIEATGLKDKEIKAYSLGFIIGPCINASGRLESADIGVELFLTDDIYKAKEYAERLHELNEERKNLTEEGFNKLVKLVEKEKYFDNPVILAYEPNIHESIAGIIAGRIKDKYYRPTIVLTSSQEAGRAKGSARSIEEYNMYEKINAQRDLLVSFGGHPMAAGLSLMEENIEEFYSALIHDADLSENDLTAKIYMDLYMPIRFADFDLVYELERLEPYGKGNPKPIFADKDLSVEKIDILGKNKNVLKFDLISDDGSSIEGIHFGDSENFKEYVVLKFGKDNLNKALRGLDNDIYIDIIYYPNINEFMNNKTLQAVIQSYR